MTSTLGSARDTPAQGHVKFVPSMRNRFSLPPEPNAETVVAVPLDGDVGETPGAALIASNMLNRRDGIALRYSGPKRVSNPLLRASMREPAPWTTTDSAIPATFNTTVRSSVAPIPIRTSASWYVANPGRSMSSAYEPGGRTGNRSCPLTFVVIVAGPPINAGEATRTNAP